MNTAVSDSTTLMHLAKIGKINFLKKIYDEIIIEDEVYKEIIERGKEHIEVPLIKKLIEDKFITVKKVSQKIEMLDLHEGERMFISLWKELRIESLLIDDEDGFKVAAMLNLTPIRTTSILIILLDKKLINLEEYEKSIRELSESGYFLDALTYERLLAVGKNLRK